MWLALKNRLHAREILAQEGWRISLDYPLYGSNAEIVSYLLLK